MPVMMIMTAANTVSRGSCMLGCASASMSETISATSMMVTATASTSVPYGSPMRSAMTSA